MDVGGVVLGLINARVQRAWGNVAERAERQAMECLGCGNQYKPHDMASNLETVAQVSAHLLCETCLTLAFPPQPGAEHVSILSPDGSPLIGSGQAAVSVTGPDTGTRTLIEQSPVYHPDFNIEPGTSEPDKFTRLASERDELAAKVAELERQLDEVTRPPADEGDNETPSL